MDLLIWPTPNSCTMFKVRLRFTTSAVISAASGAENGSNLDPSDAACGSATVSRKASMGERRGSSPQSEKVCFDKVLNATSYYNMSGTPYSVGGDTWDIA